MPFMRKKWPDNNWPLRIGALALVAMVGSTALVHGWDGFDALDWATIGLAAVLFLYGVWTELRRRHVAG
jgi:hypothetical protein